MKKTILTGAAALLLALPAHSQGTHFLPQHLAILRAGDGVVNLRLRQAPIFVDQYDLEVPNTAPSFTVSVPTNGANSFFFNGHAASEGVLARSPDQKLLSFGGYGGVDLLQVNGTASRLDIQRGICTVDSAGAIHTYLYKAIMKDSKANPRGVVGDGAGSFWGCGNANGTYFFSPSTQSEPVRFSALPGSRAIEIVHNALYASISEADGGLIDKPSGIYAFEPEALPKAANTSIRLVVPTTQYTKVAGLAVSPKEDVAYMADAMAGVQKYVKSSSDGTWKLAYNISVPQNIPKNLNNADGCFGLVADFSGSTPILYATTTEGYGNAVNSNRVVRIVDTNSSAIVTTLVQADSTNIALRGVDFTPN